MSVIEKLNMNLRIINKDPFKRSTIQTHRGNMIALNPGQAETIDFGSQKEPQRALDFYKKYRNIEVVWLDRPNAEKLSKESDEANSELQQDGSQDVTTAQDDQQGSDEDQADEDDDDQDEDSEDEGSSEDLTREQVEELGYKELVKYARSKGVQAQKKAEILKELFGEE